MKNKITIPCLLLNVFLTFSLSAQVSIGSQTAKQEEAALLQIKGHDAASDGGATAEKGVLLPRVQLKSLSDISVITGAEPDKIAALTGLLVYNVSGAGMDEGIYEWDGREWGALEVLSDDVGAYTQKAIVQTGDLTDANTPSVNVGEFTFRFSPGRQAQCRLSRVPGRTVIGYQICRFWQAENAGTHIGCAFDSKTVTLQAGNTGWVNLHSRAMASEERWEVWIVDVANNKIYNVQYIIYQPATSGTLATYIVLVTEY
jgi:hypothetical protein